MKLDDLIFVSVDDHAIEPPNAFTPHMPAKYKGREPRFDGLRPQTRSAAPALGAHTDVLLSAAAGSSVETQ